MIFILPILFCDKFKKLFEICLGGLAVFYANIEDDVPKSEYAFLYNFIILLFNTAINQLFRRHRWASPFSRFANG